MIEKEEIIELDDYQSGDEGKKRGSKMGTNQTDRIFGYNNFNEFRSKYFGGREVNPLEDLTRKKIYRDARKTYSKRFNPVNDPSRPII